VLLVQNLTKHFQIGFVRKKHIFSLEEISFFLKKGELIHLIGANGSGKSTTLKIIMGLIKQTAGDVFFEEKPITEKERKNIAYLPEKIYPFLSLTPQEHLNFFLSYTRNFSQKKSFKKEIEQSLLWAELQKERWDIPLRFLSKGSRKKVLWAEVFLSQAKLYILDEPFCDLDESFRLKSLSWIENKLKEKESSFLLCNHYKEDLFLKTSQVLYLDNGRLS